MDINKKEYAEKVEVYRCPNCSEYFIPAPRCPHCGQLISNGKANTEALVEALQMWAEGKRVAGITMPNTLALLDNLVLGAYNLRHFGKYSTVCVDEIEYWKFFGFNVKSDEIGWVIT